MDPKPDPLHPSGILRPLSCDRPARSWIVCFSLSLVAHLSLLIGLVALGFGAGGSASRDGSAGVFAGQGQASMTSGQFACTGDSAPNVSWSDAADAVDAFQVPTGREMNPPEMNPPEMNPPFEAEPSAVETPPGESEAQRPPTADPDIDAALVRRTPDAFVTTPRFPRRALPGLSNAPMIAASTSSTVTAPASSYSSKGGSPRSEFSQTPTQSIASSDGASGRGKIESSTGDNSGSLGGRGRSGVEVHHARAMGAAGGPDVGNGFDLNGIPRPQYPDLLRRRGEFGTVELQIEVLPSGFVGDIEVVRSPGFPPLVEQARRAVRAARFSPATRDGLPVTEYQTYSITFRR